MKAEISEMRSSDALMKIATPKGAEILDWLFDNFTPGEGAYVIGRLSASLMGTQLALVENEDAVEDLLKMYFLLVEENVVVARTSLAAVKREMRKTEQ